MQIKNLYHITHRNNLPSIFERGILSDDMAKAECVHPTPIYDVNNVKHHNYKTPDGKELWFYANLYFQPRNAMMYRVVHQKDLKDLAVVGIDKKVLDAQDVVITDGSTTDKQTQFYLPSEGLKMLRKQWKIIQEEWWNNFDGSKRKMMAECLIPNSVKPGHIHSVYVADDKTRKAVQETVGKREITVCSKPDLFFQPNKRTKIGENISLIDGGDIFFSELQTLTVTVNLQGVMGKGLALRAREQFPDVYVVYEKACRAKKITSARPYTYKREASVAEELTDVEPDQECIKNPIKWFLLFATKRHWRANSRIEDIEDGLQWLQKNFKKQGIQSLAMPALGCGLGGLDWKEVGPLMCKSLHGINIPIAIYLPREYPIAPQYLTESHLLSP